MSRAFCAGADWGTSSFRLWIFGSGGEVIAERRSQEGLSAASGGFAAILENHLAATGAPASLPVVICGMAGARQGWIEAGYVDTPARLSDIAHNAVRAPTAGRDVRILPGLAQRRPELPDVLRGEETQLLGRPFPARRLACLPGTHSKWVELDGSTVLGFTSFMTGELFSVLAEHSILRHSLATNGAPDPRGEAFISAARAGFDAPELLTSALFRVRAGDLLSLGDPQGGAATLSGLLIGAEIAGATRDRHTASGVALIASGKLADLYAGALSACRVPYEALDADAAARDGLFAAARGFWAGEETR